MSVHTERLEEYGVLGEVFADLCSEHGDVVKRYGSKSFVADLALLQQDEARLRSKHIFLPIAISLLVLPFPLQLPLSFSELKFLLVTAGVQENITHKIKYTKNFEELFPHVSRSSAVSFVHDNVHSVEFLNTCFPKKSNVLAETKINLVLHRLVASFKVNYRAHLLVSLIFLTAGRLHEDQFINLLVFGYGAAAKFGDYAWDIAVHFLLNGKAAKHISNVLKALGANTSEYGAILVEGDTLQGRCPGPFDLEADARYRVDPDRIGDKVLNAPDSLREHIRAVLLHELPSTDLSLPDLDDWWTKRWLWCVNGAQTAKSSRALGLDPRRNKGTHDREHRRMVAEALTEEPITRWSGRSTVSKSVKLENGKTRAIYAVDTTSYFAFSWIIGAAEDAWANSRVLLNPGLGGQVGIARRVKNCQRGGGVNLMLDYDDFNSHHANRTMSILFEELCDIFHAPEWYKATLSHSFEDMWMVVDGREQRVLGTMMSGHRGTAFINSVLNAAYIRCAVGGHFFDKLLSLHVGDDVYIRANTLTDCAHILDSTRAFGCRMNPTKQSIGYVGAEFLRMGMGQHAAYGYYCRGVASFVAGNWVNQELLNPVEGLQHAIAGCRTLINRSGQYSLNRLLAPAIRYARGIRLPILKRLLSGELALEGAPVYNQTTLRTIKMIPPRLPTIPLAPTWAHNATSDYLTNHVTPLELAGLEMVHADAGAMLVIPSYLKGLNKTHLPAVDPPSFETETSRLPRGYTMVDELKMSDVERGVLEGYPLLQFINRRLSDSHLRELVEYAGGDRFAADIRREAFGPAAVTRNIVGNLSYSDASALSKNSRVDNIVVLYQVYL